MRASDDLATRPRMLPLPAAHFPRKDLMLNRGWQAALVVMWVGCAGELRDPDRFAFLLEADGGASPLGDSGAGEKDAGTTMTTPSAPPECVTKIFQNSCKNVTCHGAGASQVDLVTAGVEKRLVGKMSASNGLCKNRVLVSPSGGESLLLQKITQTQPPCGAAMPPLGTQLSDTEQTCLTEWVDSLANTK
jgi:ribosomal protein S27E